jgi:hypothetical protein
MPTIEVSEETYRKLEREAARLQKTVPEVVNPFFEYVLDDPRFPDVPTLEEFLKFDADMHARAVARAHRYPSGFEADVSRESMYEGCGE